MEVRWRACTCNFNIDSLYLFQLLLYLYILSMFNVYVFKCATSQSLFLIQINTFNSCWKGTPCKHLIGILYNARKSHVWMCGNHRITQTANISFHVWCTWVQVCPDPCQCRSSDGPFASCWNFAESYTHMITKSFDIINLQKMS